MPSKRSNKTARVLNLISNPQDTDTAAAETTDAEVAAEAAEQTAEAVSQEQTAPQAEPEAAAAPESQPEAQVEPSAEAETDAAPAAPPAPASQPVVPIIQDIHEKEQVLTDAINTGLMSELETEEPPAPAAEAPAAKEEEHKPHAGDLVYVPPTSGNSASDVQMPGKNALHPPSGELDVEYVNVLQELVDEQSQYYIKNMMNCTCSRCIADMKALALTNLPAKYVVLSKSQKSAYMSVYAARYEKLLSVQLMRSCVVINESPHH